MAKSGRLELWDNIYGYYAVQGHSRSSTSVQIESPYATSY